MNTSDIPTCDFEYKGYYFELFSKTAKNYLWSVLKVCPDTSLSFVQWMKLPASTERTAVIRNFDYYLLD